LWDYYCTDCATGSGRMPELERKLSWSNRGTTKTSSGTEGKINHSICKIRGFQGGDYEEWRLLGCYAVWL
jgi:hypothetical protein